MPWRRKSYEVLPVLSVRGEHLRGALRRVTLAWMFGVVWLTIVSGSRIAIFGRMIGMNDFDFGVLAAMPFIATFGQLGAAILVENTGLRKFQFLYCAGIARMLWVAVALLPLVMPIPSRAAVGSLLVLLGVSWFFTALATPAWFSWMGDMIPRRIRGRYFGMRARYSIMVQIPLVIVIAFLLDLLSTPGEPMTVDAQPVLFYGIIATFVLAGICGTIDIMLFYNLREIMPTRRDQAETSNIRIDVARPATAGPMGQVAYVVRYGWGVLGNLLVDPLRDASFRHAVGYLATMTAGQAAMGAFIFRNALENLGFSQMGTDVVYLVIGPMFALLAAPRLGRLIDRWGRRPVLSICNILTWFSILPVFLASPMTPNPPFVVDALNALGGWVGRPGWVGPDAPVGAWLIICSSVLIGTIAWTGQGLAHSGIMLGFSESVGRSKYVAASSVIISLGGVLGGIGGGLITQSLEFLRTDPIIAGPFLWNNWHAAFLLSLAMRMLAGLWLIRFPDPGAAKLGDLARSMRSNVYNFVNSRIGWRWRVYGWTEFSPHIRQAREEHDRTVARAQEQLTDAERLVREQTAQARDTIRDAQAQASRHVDTSVQQTLSELTRTPQPPPAEQVIDNVRQAEQAARAEAKDILDQARQQARQAISEARKQSRQQKKQARQDVRQAKKKLRDAQKNARRQQDPPPPDDEA